MGSSQTEKERSLQRRKTKHSTETDGGIERKERERGEEKAAKKKTNIPTREVHKTSINGGM